MPKALRRLVVSEVSSVDRAANEGAKVVLMKRDAPVHTVFEVADELVRRGFKPGAPALRMAGALIRGTGKMAKSDNGDFREVMFKSADGSAGAFDLAADPAAWDADQIADVTKVAKALADGSITSTTITKNEFYAATRAEAVKLYPSLSPQGAVAKFIVDDPDGRALHRAAKIAVSYDVTQVTPQPMESAPSYRALVAMAREMAAASPDKSFYTCMLEVMGSPRGAELYEAARQESALASLAVINGEATIGEWKDVDKPSPRVPNATGPAYRYPSGGNATVAGRGEGYARFKAEVEKIRKAEPGLSATAAQRRAQQEHPELFRQAKNEGLLRAA